MVRALGDVDDWGSCKRTATAGTRVHARVLGPADAPTVVCVHGLGCSHRYFARFARELTPEAQVVAPDLPGFGRTPGPRRALDVRGLSRALADWIRVTERAGAALVANSAGCQVVVDMAVHAPELLGPVVLCGPTVDRRARSLLRQLARLARDVLHEPPALPLVLAKDYVTAGPQRMAATTEHVLRDRIERKVSLVGVPTVVVRGEHDPVAPHRWCAELADLLPDGRLLEVGGAGHAAHFGAPAALAAITRSVLP